MIAESVLKGRHPPVFVLLPVRSQVAVFATLNILRVNA